MAFYVTTPKIIRFQFSIANHGIDRVPLEPGITGSADGCAAAPRLQITSLDAFSPLVKPIKARGMLGAGNPAVLATKQVARQSPEKRKKELNFSPVRCAGHRCVGS